MDQVKTKSAPDTTDALSLLTEDHKKVRKMFTDFAGLMKSEKNDKEKGALVDKICEELTAHTLIEEEIFYPAVRAATEANDLMDEAEVEHAAAKELIGQLQEMAPGDDQYDAFVTLLGENVDQHVKEEQDVMFPKAKKTRLDLDALGAQMLERRHELQEIVLAA